MQNAEYAVTRLTETHAVKVGDATGECEPLLDMLREARYPNLGRTKGGGGTGDVFDVKAVEMYETIDAGVRAWLNSFREHSTGDLIPLTKRLYQMLRAEDAGGRLEDPERMFAMFPTWVQRIEEHFDPPHEYELTAACPECGEGRTVIGEEPKPGARDERPLKWAVCARVKPGRAIIAECFVCGKLWAGEQQVKGLAESMGIEVDWAAARTAFDTPNETTPM